MSLLPYRERLASRPALALLAVLFGAALWFYSRQPLHHTDLWGHLAYGRLIWQTGRIPRTEPFMPLARGIPLIDTAWLSQVAGYLVTSRFGPAGIQFIHAAAVALCFACVALASYRITRNVPATVAGLALFASLSWYQFQIARPQTAGALCYCMLLAVLIAPRWCRPYFLAVPALFCVWANLHGSFVMGIALLGCASLGRAIEVARRTRSAAAATRDAVFKRLALLTLLAALAGLANPYGWRVYAEVLSFSRNPNLTDVIEWQPLALGTRQGKIAVGAALALLIAWALSPRRLRAAELLAVVGLGVATFASARMIVWWAPLVAVSCARHALAAWGRLRPISRHAAGRSQRTVSWMVAAIVVAATSLVVTPLGMQVLSGRECGLDEAVSAQTPVAATAWLRAHPPAGQVFNSYAWGDYLIWAGPPNVPVFVTSQAHLVPPPVWRDYMSVIGLSPRWRDILDEYGVQVVLIDQRRRERLVERLDQDRHWHRAYADRIAVIFTRRETRDE